MIIKKQAGHEQVTAQTIKIRVIATIVFAGVCFAMLRAYLGDYLSHGQYPYNTFLFDPADRFNDLFNVIAICRDNNPYFVNFKFTSNYFPMANSFFYLFSLLQHHWLIGFAFLGGFVALYSYLIKNYFKHSWRRHFLELLIIFFFSYPIFFNVDRMNLELYNFVFCLLWFYFRKQNKPLLAAFFLSLSISFKLYTCLFALLYLKEKQYKYFFITGILTGVITVLSLLTFQGGQVANIHGMLQSLNKFTAIYIDGYIGLHHNLSLFGALKVLAIIFMKLFQHRVTAAGGLNRLLPAYSVFTLLSFAAIIFFVFKKNMPVWKNTFLLCAILILFPHVSYDYKLIFMYIPLIFFLREKESRGDVWYAAGFALLLIPNNYIYIVKDISVAVLIYPAVILLMSLVILIKPEREYVMTTQPQLT